MSFGPAQPCPLSSPSTAKALLVSIESAPKYEVLEYVNRDAEGLAVCLEGRFPYSLSCFHFEA